MLRLLSFCQLLGNCLLMAVLCVFPLSADAQQVGTPAARPMFGFISYMEALESMPAFAEAVNQMDTLTAQYDAEIRRAEEEFNAKYEEFLDGQAEFPSTILKKRQAELQELMDKNIAFRDESRRLLDQAREEIFAPLHSQLRQTISSVAASMHLAFVINADDNACLYLDTSFGVDITQQVKDALQ